MDHDTPRQSLSERDASGYTGMSRAYLRQARMRGDGPAYVRIGRAIRYRLPDLTAWIDEHRIVPGGRPPKAT